MSDISRPSALRQDGDSNETDVDDDGITVVDEAESVLGDPAEPDRAVMRLDRSQARLRLPTEAVPEVLRIANNLGFADTTVADISDLDVDLVEDLTLATVMDDGRFDPIAEHLLTIINRASLMITIDLNYGPDSSHRTIWATPRAAVISNDVDHGVIELGPADVVQLPAVLGQALLAGSPRFVGESPISVSTEALAEAERLQDDDESAAKAVLTGAGLSEAQADIVSSFGDQVRRWRITSAWSTEDTQESRELRGIDAGEHGQWLAAMTGSRDSGRGQMTFTPQGHGDVMRSLRSILPKVWFGRPLKAPAI